MQTPSTEPAGDPFGQPPRSPAGELGAQLDRTVDRLRGMGIARLGAAFEPEPTRADAARATAQRIEDATASLERRDPRPLPVLKAAAAGDQLAVVGHDLLAAAASAPGDETDALLLEAAASLLDLRRRV